MAGNRTEPDTPPVIGQKEAAGTARGDIAIVIPEAREGDAFRFPERRGSKGSQGVPHRLGARLVVGFVSIGLGAGAGLLAAQLLDQGQPPRSNVPEIERDEFPGPVVPEVAGLSAAEARSRLVDSSLRLERLVPTPGEPGVVMRARPGSGRPVSPGAGVILYVGVDPTRLEQESNGP
jgi:hypothetical protein